MSRCLVEPSICLRFDSLCLEHTASNCFESPQVRSNPGGERPDPRRVEQSNSRRLLCTTSTHTHTSKASRIQCEPSIGQLSRSDSCLARMRPRGWTGEVRDVSPTADSTVVCSVCCVRGPNSSKTVWLMVCSLDVQQCARCASSVASVLARQVFKFDARRLKVFATHETDREDTTPTIEFDDSEYIFINCGAVCDRIDQLSQSLSRCVNI